MLKPMTALLVAALSTSTAFAADTIAVSFTDLNLGTPAGQTALAKRIDRAARQICIVNDNDIAMQRAQQHCLTSARESARRQVAEVMAKRSNERVALNTATPSAR